MERGRAIADGGASGRPPAKGPNVRPVVRTVGYRGAVAVPPAKRPRRTRGRTARYG